MKIIESKWQDLKKWYAEIAEILGELLKHIIQSLPKAILGILGFLTLMFFAVKYGKVVFLIYIVLLFLGLVIYEKYIKKT